MSDRRDPSALGEALLARRAAVSPASIDRAVGTALSQLYDSAPLDVPDYDADPGPVEKYGDPRRHPPP